MLTEVTVPGQQETTISMDIVKPRNGEKSFVAMTVTGPENAFCMRLNRGAAKVLRNQLDHLIKEMR